MYLTEEGWAALRRQVLPLMELENAVLGGWTEEDRRAYLRLTEKFLEDFRAGLRTLQKGDPL